MTETEWLVCDDPVAIIGPVLGLARATPRKARLCATAWCRAFFRRVNEAPNTLPAHISAWIGPQFLPQLDVNEGFADGDVGAKSLRAARPVSGGPYNLFRRATSTAQIPLDSLLKLLQKAQAEFNVLPNVEICDILHDIFGEPFRPISINPNWLNPTVTNLATAAYEQRVLPSGELDNTPLAILSDALEEAGCDNADMLGHLRGPGPHVRGCWALDLCLGLS